MNDKEEYRNVQFECESFRYPKTIAKSMLKYRFANLIGRVTKYALEKIHDELSESLKLKESSEKADEEDCCCDARRVYLLPCRHQLLRAPEVVPLEVVHSRWHILLHNGQGTKKKIDTYLKTIPKSINRN